MLFVFLFVQLQAVIFRFLSHHTDNNVTPGEEATRSHPVSKADYTSLTTPQIFPRTYPACQIWKLTRPFPSPLFPVEPSSSALWHVTFAGVGRYHPKVGLLLIDLLYGLVHVQKRFGEKVKKGECTDVFIAAQWSRSACPGFNQFLWGWFTLTSTLVFLHWGLL